jgi:hypothetical protein
MRGKVILLAVFVAVGLACNDFGNPSPETSPVEPPINPPVGSGSASFLLNENRHVISVLSQGNGYVPNEVVLRGSGEGLENTLMLTFKPIQGKPAEINLQMTGYWDLGLCIPFKRYLVSHASTNVIRVTSYDLDSGLLKGEFDLTFIFENDPTRIASFKNGTFEATVDTAGFKYCIEG